MKYIFVAGAPGSKWSSVVKNIYYSPSIDRSDYSEDRLYYHDASGEMQLMHLGAYFDPGMEFNIPEYFNNMPAYDAKRIFDQPFSNTNEKVRIIKSHIFCYIENIKYLQQNFPESPIVLVHRPDDSCLGWWVKCGHFDITYPKYNSYYKDLKTMAGIIKKQNEGIMTAMDTMKPHQVYNNARLALLLGIDPPPAEYAQNYTSQDITVKVLL